jgi:hypothetical protein
MGRCRGPPGTPDIKFVLFFLPAGQQDQNAFANGED